MSRKRSIELQTPSFGQQLPHSSSFEFRKERTTVNTPEVTDITLPVEFLGHNGETRRLLEIQTSG
jgi:hypothetical protein